MDERSKQIALNYCHVPQRYDAIGGFRPKENTTAYIAFADVANTNETLEFVVFADHYKAAWSEGRRQVRVDAGLLPIEPQFDDDGNVTNLIRVEPGRFKVRSVFKIDRAPAKTDNAVTARDLLNAANERGVRFNEKLWTLLAQLENADASNNDDQRDAA